MTRIRVALVAPTLDILGGHSVQASRLLDAWRGDAEVDVHLVPINPRRPRLLAPLSRMRYARTAATQLSYWPLLLRELRRADVVHVFATSNSSFFVAALPALLVSHALGKRIVVNYRGDGREHLVRSSTARRALRSVDLNVVPSAYFHRIFDEVGLPAHIVPNITDLSRFSYRVRNPLRPRLLSTRNFEANYDVACTLRAFAHLQGRFAEASLVLVGAGSQEGALRKLAQDLGLRHVTFAGRAPQTDMPRYYADADIYVQTPVIDNMPGSVIEAFASGLPVVSTGVGGVPVILTHGRHGLLAAPGDAAGVAAHVATLLDDPPLARQMAAAAMLTCQAYDRAVVREHWRTVYRSLAGAAAGAAAA